jgi:hypothetical protein
MDTSESRLDPAPFCGCSELTLLSACVSDRVVIVTHGDFTADYRLQGRS